MLRQGGRSDFVRHGCDRKRHSRAEDVGVIAPLWDKGEFVRYVMWLSTSLALKSSWKGQERKER